MGTKSGIYLLLALFTAVIALSCGGDDNGDAEADEKTSEELIAVEIYPVQSMELARYVEYSGVLEAVGDVTIGAETGGKIARLRFNEGDKVNAGDEVIRLDDTSARLSHQVALAALENAELTLAIAEDPVREGQLAQLESALNAAQAQFEVAEAGLERAENLFDEGAIPEADLDAARAGYEGAKAARDNAREVLNLALEGSREEELEAARTGVEAARANVGLAADMLSKTSIKSPIDGVISDIYFDNGELVGPGTPVLRVVNNDLLRLTVGVGDRVVPSLSVGQKCDIIVDAFSDAICAGELTRVGIAADPMTGTFPVELTITNPDGILLAGMVARTRLLVEEVADGLVIPLYAVLPGEEGQVVFIEIDGMAEMRNVKVALVVDDLASITSGIEPGDHVIVRGAVYLEDGEDVRVVDTWEHLKSSGIE